jgi:hypothetical protein
MNPPYKNSSEIVAACDSVITAYKLSPAARAYFEVPQVDVVKEMAEKYLGDIENHLYDRTGIVEISNKLMTIDSLVDRK